LIGILLKLRECEQEFYEQMEIIDKQNSEERDAEKEGKFYAGISDLWHPLIQTSNTIAN
jgi:hypothetical protein